MMPELPFYISLVFILITIITIALFHRTTGRHKWLLTLIIVIAICQAGLGLGGFFLKTDSVPPRMLFLLIPAILLILFAFFTVRGKNFIKQIDLERYTYLHTIRIFVEIVLLLLFLQDTLPQTMTFEGRNFDILAGLTAPLVGYYGFGNNKLSARLLLLWNIVCLLLVMQVVITGLFSAPSVIQQFTFDAPNFAVFYFPFVWLPGIVVPIVIFGHLVSIYRLRTAQVHKNKYH